MTQKLLIIGLALAIVAVIGIGLIDAGHVSQDLETVSLAATTLPVDTATPLPTGIPTTESSDSTGMLSDEATAELEPIVQAQEAMGDPWQSDGTISVLEDYGFTLTTTLGDYYVELGPPTYWQAQGISLAVGDAVSVDGYYNGEQVHARVVTINDAELVIRDETGQPLWSGGVANANGQNATSDTGTHTAGSNTQFQVAAEDWLTLTGIIGSVSNGNVTLNVDDGTVLSLQMGQPQFWQSQGITLSVGDPVEVLGFWSGDQFMAGDIRKTETGETIMLRDPNGRQLWAGPGRNGNQGNSNQSNSNQGNGYRGGREG